MVFSFQEKQFSITGIVAEDELTIAVTIESLTTPHPVRTPSTWPSVSARRCGIGAFTLCCVTPNYVASDPRPDRNLDISDETGNSYFRFWLHDRPRHGTGISCETCFSDYGSSGIIMINNLSSAADILIRMPLP